MSDLITNEYNEFLVDIKTRIRKHQYQAFRAVNTEMVELYWEIGESIDLKQKNLVGERRLWRLLPAIYR